MGSSMNYELLHQGLEAPICLTWEITYGCNLRCTHCLSASGKRADNELSLEESKHLLDEFAEMQVFYINIGGGEPFIRPDFFNIVEYSVQKGIGFHVSTNGTLLSEKSVRRIAGLPGLRVQVSLDGVDEATNDAIRGRGSYRKAMQALALLQRHSIDLSINCVLTRFSFLQLDALYELARTYGARLRLSRLRPSGRGKERWDLLHPTREQNVHLYYWLREHPEVVTGDSFFFLSALGPQLDGLGMCGAGRVTCCITPTGDVYACPFLLSPQFWAGNVREQPFSVIWRDSPVFQQLRQYEVEACQSCLLFHSCHGGCIAASFYVTGALGNPDPECVAITSLNERTA